MVDRPDAPRLSDAAPLARHGGAAPGGGEPVAIVGIGCRLPPRLDTPEALFRALGEGVDAVREVPPERWSLSEWFDEDPQAPGKMATRWGGFLDDVAGFDAGFFRITPAEAKQIDPQQRLALEVAYAALEDARLSPFGLAGSRTGVFLGAMWQEYRLFAGGDASAIRAHSAAGSDNSVVSGRVAYALGLRGPALTVATSSSSSLVAVHLAVQSLRRGECDLALAGGVNLMLHPHASVAMTKLGTQSPDGKCRAFDANGRGYVRGEGCGVVVLRRLSDALAAGDRVYAVVRGSAINNDGASDGLTAPSPEAQAEVLRAAWRDAGVAPREVSYVECHGTGTPVGDPVEAAALGAVFAGGRSSPLRIGSAKTNFGHLEPASGVVGLLKVALSLYYGELVPSLHFETPNPRIDFEANGLEVVVARRPWPAEGRRFAGVSNFGFSGTNAHLALEEAPGPRGAPPPSPRGGAAALSEGATPRPVCLVVSGKGEAARAENAARLAERLRGRGDDELVDVAYSLATTRAHFDARASVAAHTAAEAASALEALAQGQAHPAVTTALAAPRGKVVFVFPGQGAQWHGMGRALFDECPAFRDAVNACDRAFLPHTGWSVAALLRGEGGALLPPLDRIDAVQPALFTMYVALAASLRARGLEPEAVVGHSQGEVAAAVVGGALTLDEGALVVAKRSRAIHERGRRGAMAVVERPVDEVLELIAPHGEALSIAVVNAKSSTVVSGDADAVERLVAEFSGRGAFCRRINVDYASHSAHMNPLLPGLGAELGGLRPGPSRVPFYSSVEGELLEGGRLDGAYWCKNLREPVRFDRALERLLADGYGAFVEVSPHPVLAMALTDGSAERGGAVVGCLQRDRGGLVQLWRTLGGLHAQGHEVRWGRAFEGLGARRVDLPTYAFQRRRYWLDAPEGRPSGAEAPGRVGRPSGDDGGGAPAEGPSLRERLSAIAGPERLPWLTELVRREAASVLGLPDAAALSPDRVLREQGFDSLTVVELRNRLVERSGVTLPTTLAFDYPTPKAVAGLLLGKLLPGDALGGAPPPGRAPEEALAWALSRLSAAQLQQSGLLARLVDLAAAKAPPGGGVDAPKAPSNGGVVDDPKRAAKELSVAQLDEVLDALLDN